MKENIMRAFFQTRSKSKKNKLIMINFPDPEYIFTLIPCELRNFFTAFPFICLAFSFTMLEERALPHLVFGIHKNIFFIFACMRRIILGLDSVIWMDSFFGWKCKRSWFRRLAVWTKIFECYETLFCPWLKTEFYDK